LQKNLYMKLIEFNQHFPDEASCRESFRKQREKNGVVCRHCGSKKHKWMKTISQFQCVECRTRTTLRSGTLLEDSNLPFMYWYFALHLMTCTKKGFSAKEVQRQLGHKRYEPIWYMMHKIRIAMGNRDDRYKLKDFNEMDEGFFPCIPTKTDEGFILKRGRGSQKRNPVLVMAQTEKVKDKKKHRPATRCLFFKMKVMPDQSAETVNQITSESICSEASVKTDKYTSYVKLFRIIKKHIYSVIPKKMAGKELPWVHTVIANAKRNFLNNFHHINDIYLQNYLDEFAYKLNRRYIYNLFDNALAASVDFNWKLMVYNNG
jgi:hypothetical protein